MDLAGKLEKLLSASVGMGAKHLVQDADPPYFTLRWTGNGSVYNLTFPVVSDDFPH